jgi:hypothetical protein
LILQLRITNVIHEDHGLELLAEIIRRGQVVNGDNQTPREQRDRLLRELVDLGARASDSGVPREDWESHELNWLAYCATLRSSLMREAAWAIIEFERNARASEIPVKLTDEATKILTWWHFEGGRNQLLSELPIEERHELERAEKE